ncbi:FMN adenylyltransferase [Magnetococcus marinus MC-1]|uniref:Riboflavin biosynthesis protein n=1 Tax=Magnetococcus marinus (strain ATCC BAA-1437 / JCM 17883 / MC-1) TaxID=156889 RepID=A0L9K6_MAGMM|nr:riboflavin biosynthesis protein RibF [Magnetococcus marinus]ABK44649.1 FMN adenylyltransferase [Magnetococcus marinus MC-1]
MYIIRGLINLPDRFRGAVLTIGNFDGVHRGHQRLFAQLHALGQLHQAPTMAMTFEPHPRRVLRPEQPLDRITGVRGKARWMDQYGLDAMFICRFTRQLQTMPAEDFVRDLLAHGLGIREVVIGENFRFGSHGRGDFNTLANLGQRYGFGAHKAELLLEGGVNVSSTGVRQAIRQADFKAAEALLGRPFEIEGRVIAGMRRGRGLGFPTANVALYHLLYPPVGVYLVEAMVEGLWCPAIANIGSNPTFGDEGLHMEVHMLVPCSDLYHRNLRVKFHAFVRGEHKFPDVEALKAQIGADVAAAKTYFNL